jgi:23S rRNA (uracil1939-C5)-methyltransferase
MPMVSPDRFELVPQKLVYGGAALGHHAGRPVLVPYALPGERVEVESVRDAKGMVYARLLQVLDPGPARVAAPCPYFGRCGGCHYQHLDATRQLEIKREILRETLRRVGHIDWQGEIGVHASEPWHYRNQVQLKIRPGPAESTDAENAGSGVGFFAADSHHLVAIDACPISSPRLNGVIAELSRPEWAARLAGWSEVELRTDDRDERVVLTFLGAAADLEQQALERLAGECMSLLPGAAGVAFEAPGAREAPSRGQSRGQARGQNRASRRPPSEWRAFGNATLTYRVGEFDYRISPGSFFQSSRFLLPDLVAAVTAGVRAPSGLGLDLYAGVGLFTVPLARAFGQVAAVEASALAAADLAANLRSHGAANARATHSTAAGFLRRYAQSAPDLVVLDPPRAGAEGETLRRLAALGPAEIRYVSCHPPTLARDLAALVQHAYAIEQVELFDLFPQTFHIETVVTLRKA